MKFSLRFSFLLLIFIARIAHIDSTAYVTCPPGDCSFPIVTPVTVENEEIIFDGQPATYIDSVTEYLQFEIGSVFNFIPTNMFKYFSNFRGFIAYNTSTTTIVTDAFNHCPLLEVLYIYYSPFEVLPAGFAQTCEKISYIDIQNNLLSYIDREAFRGLKNVKNIFLGYNKITCIPPGLFDYTPELRTINFAFNDIYALDPNTFANMPYIQDINLSNCQLVILSNLNLACTGVVSGLNLMLEDNPINAVDPNFILSLFSSRVSIGGSNIPTVSFINQTGPFKACMSAEFHIDPTLTQSTHVAANPYFNACYNMWNTLDPFTLKCFGSPGLSIVHPLCEPFQNTVQYVFTTAESTTFSTESTTSPDITTSEVLTTEPEVVTQGKLI